MYEVSNKYSYMLTCLKQWFRIYYFYYILFRRNIRKIKIGYLCLNTEIIFKIVTKFYY